MTHAVNKKRVLATLFAICAGLLSVPAKSVDFIVTKIADTADGACTPADCSLREAIIDANATPGPDTITLFAGVFTIDRAGANENLSLDGDLDITDQVTITGAGQGVTIIDAINNGDRIFHIRSPNGVDTVIATITGVTIQNAGINGADGGAIYIGAKADLRLNDVAVVDNKTTNASQTTNVALGGGIYNAGKLTMLGGSLSRNTANLNQTTGQATFGGGGLYNADGATATLRGVTIQGNWANNGTLFASGGGILNIGTLTIREHPTTKAETLIGGTDRSAPVVNKAFSGGGVSNIGGILAISNSTIRNNLATTDDPNGTGNGGGGIYLNSAGNNRGNAIVTASTISDNESSIQGGGVFSAGIPLDISHTTINNNKARYTGGGLVLQGNTPADITNSTIAFNYAVDTATSAATKGGGIHLTGRANLTSTTIAGNFSTTGQQINVQNNATSPGATKPQITLTNTIVSHDGVVLGASLASIAANNCAQGDLVANTNDVTPIPAPTNATQFAASYIQSRTYNLDSGNSCAFGAQTTFNDQINTDPVTDPNGLQNNGGPTPTLAIDASTSPAVNKRGSDGCPSRDQRYYIRSGECDKGAYEALAIPSAPDLVDIKLTIVESADPIAVGEGNQVVYTLTVTNISREDSESISIESGTISGEGSLVETPRIVVGTGGTQTCSAVASTFQCSLGSLPALSTTKVSVTVAPTAVGTITIEADAFTTDPSRRNSDPFLTNNSARETTRVTSGTDSSVVQGNFGSGGGGTLGWLTLAFLAFSATLRLKAFRSIQVC